MTHSPEPWTATTIIQKNNTTPFEFVAITSADKTVFYCSVFGDSLEQMQANRDRIVACVNALAGIETELLAHLPSRRLLVHALLLDAQSENSPLDRRLPNLI